MTILDRYLAKELVLPFLAGIAGFVMMMIPTILFGMLDLIANRSVSAVLVAKAALLRLPGLMVWAPPIATLFGVSLGVSRLTRDNEIAAMRMSGIPLRRMLAPILVVGAAASVVSLLINETISPRTNRKFMQVWREIVTSQYIPEVQQNVFFTSENYCFYVGKVERVGKGRFRLRNVMVYELRSAGFPVLTTAKQAVSTGTVWKLMDGFQIYLDSQGRSRIEVPFKEMTLNLSQTPEEFFLSQRLPEEMSAAELKRQIELYQRSGISVGAMQVEYQFKFAIPFACLVLAIIGMPLSVHFSRFGGFAGLLIGIVLSFFYWNAYFLGQKLGAGGRVPAFLAAWTPNILFAAIGLYMLWREE